MAANQTTHRGMILIVSSPSGAGKTTLTRRLLKNDDNFILSVSVTTRPPRPGEIDGSDYIFVDNATFEEMVAGDELLEHAIVFGHRYGTPGKPVLEAVEQGRDVLFDIDWQGRQQVARHIDQDLVTIFILPPSTAELESRLRGRAQDPSEVVDGRMAKAPEEMSHWHEYDYVVINDSLDDCLGEIRSIIAAERLKTKRQQGLKDFVQTLMDHS